MEAVSIRLDCLLERDRVHPALEAAYEEVLARRRESRAARQETGSAPLEFPSYTLTLDHFDSVATTDRECLQMMEFIARMGGRSNVRLVLRAEFPHYPPGNREGKLPLISTFGSYVLRDAVEAQRDKGEAAAVRFEEITA